VSRQVVPDRGAGSCGSGYCEFFCVIFQEIRTELNKIESSVTEMNNNINSLSADEVFEELDDVTQLMTQVSSKWESLRSSVAATEAKFQMLKVNYPTFTGEFSSMLSLWKFIVLSGPIFLQCFDTVGWLIDP